MISTDTDFWKRDLDVLVPDPYLVEIAKNSSISENQLREITLSKNCSNFYTKADDFSQVKWVMPLGIRTKNKRFGLQACPCCLKEDKKSPYFRQYWRLGFFTACIWHGVQMIDQCPECQSPLTLKKSYKDNEQVLYDAENLAYCHACGFDLRKTVPCYASQEELSINKQHFFLFRNGCGDIEGLTFNYSNLYFLGIRRLLSSLICNPLNKTLTDYLCGKLNLPYKIIHSDIRSHSEPEMLTIKERSTGLLMLKYLLSNWPDNFIQSCLASKVSFQNLYAPALDYPFWILSVFREHLVTETYRPDKKETLFASNTLQAKLNRKPSLAELRRFMKIQVSYKPFNLSTVDKITSSEYHKIVKNILDILNGDTLTEFKRAMLNRHLLIFMLVVEGKMNATKVMALKFPNSIQNQVLINWGINPEKCHVSFKEVLVEYLASTWPLFTTGDTDRLIISSVGTYGNITTVMTSLRRIFQLNKMGFKGVDYLVSHPSARQ